MPATGLFIETSPDISNADMITVAQRADALGYHSLWTGESWGRDVFTVLTMLACHTQSVHLGTGIATVFSRTPSLIAQSIASLDSISEGRAILGLGTSGRIVIENWHGLPYRKPLARTREYIEIIRQALAGEQVNHQGELFQLARFRMTARPVQKQVPIYLATLGPKNLELTGQLADGWLPTWVGRKQLPELKGQIADAASKAGRDIADITVAPYIMCYAADDPDELAEGEKRIRAHLAYYIGGMGDYYHALATRQGYAAEADATRQAWAEGDRAKAASALSDDMLNDIAVLGNSAQCRANLDDFRRAGVDMPILTPPRGASLPGVLRTLEALAPEESKQPATQADRT
ncbi:MAG: hypothetical protein BZY81_08415 [SAR202 cluster bacterium Io17-Chloro-G4]|nr:MAG: hypothetical protein BZY81_08415 [SAR202 cluster bacterium Io17-Chloro-G4]